MGLDQPHLAVLRYGPRVYDAQKATRITLFHALLHYVLGRIWMAGNLNDAAFAKDLTSFGDALGRSEYLDGHQTDWSQQFWALVWRLDGRIELE
ncbi:hypothetical protein ACRAWD_11285 [Caulobacter segnis]